MGGKYIEDIDEEFDVYVTDDKLIRNSKLLIAIAKGAAVVSIKWLEESQKKRSLIVDDMKQYHIIDKNFET